MSDTISLVFVYANNGERLRVTCSPETTINEIVDGLVDHWQLPPETLNLGYRLDSPRRPLRLERNRSLAHVGVEDGDLLRFSQVFSIFEKRPAPWLNELPRQAPINQPQPFLKDTR